ncbi:hypothetical protein [Anaeromyxobacter terrae]|uniref:hypothetical protein n=1 Tax=Anaeromyxobacter terrae TaxID=2925406 RepID=UPI001F563733|nr:hypothetical protein [Anaeromyxobacter sp. SG22]
MFDQVLTYWATNWIPLLTGAVIAAVLVPTIKWAVTHAVQGVRSGVAGFITKARARVGAARHARRLRRVRSGQYVGRLSVGDFKTVVADTPVDRLHPTYQAEWKQVEQAMKKFVDGMAGAATLMNSPGRGR